jgi:hypothetical protein
VGTGGKAGRASR